VADRAVVGAVRAAVVGVQILDQAGAEVAERQRPALGDAVCVAGVGEEIADWYAAGGHPLEHGDERGRRVVLA
jgi:hypothetical protein